MINIYKLKTDVRKSKTGFLSKNLLILEYYVNKTDTIPNPPNESIKATSFWEGTWETDSNSGVGSSWQKHYVKFSATSDNTLEGEFKAILLNGIPTKGTMEGKISSDGIWFNGTWKQDNGDFGNFDFKLIEEENRFEGNHTAALYGNGGKCEWNGKKKK